MYMLNMIGAGEQPNMSCMHGLPLVMRPSTALQLLSKIVPDMHTVRILRSGLSAQGARLRRRTAAHAVTGALRVAYAEGGSLADRQRRRRSGSEHEQSVFAKLYRRSCHGCWWGGKSVSSRRRS